MSSPTSQRTNTDPAAPAAPELARLVSIDRSVRAPVLFFFASAAAWLLLGSTLGVIAAIKLHAPEFLGDVEALTYGRVRAAHLNSVAYGWVCNGLFGMGLWLMHRLSRVELRQGWVVLLGGALWNGVLTWGTGALLAGRMTGVEWLEMPGETAPLLAVAFLLIGTWIVAGFARRGTGAVYISQWYLAGAMLWFPMVWCAAQMLLFWQPARGTVQALVQGWFADSLTGLWMTPAGVAALYYFIPKVLGRPVYSRSLALIGFWTLALFTPWAGAQRWLGGPVPVWMQSVGVVASLLLLVPVAVTALNLHCTVSGRAGWRLIWQSPTLRFVVFGAFSYTLSGVVAAAGALREISAVTQFTSYATGQAHLAMHAFVGMVLFGAMYFVLPRLLGREWPSVALVNVHFWLSALGTAGFVLCMGARGVLQGLAMNTVAVPFLDIVRDSLPWHGLGTASGIVMTVGHIAFALNFAWLLAGGTAARETTGPTLFTVAAPAGEGVRS